MTGITLNKLLNFFLFRDKKRSIVWGVTLVMFSGFLCLPAQCFSQNDSDYYEIPIYLEVNRFGGTEIPSVIKGREVYLSITGLFNFLKIKNIPSKDFDTVSGFVISEKDAYTINRINNTIMYKGSVYKLKKNDLLRTGDNLYLAIKYFGEIFDLECIFDFRALKVTLNTSLVLPAIKDMRLAEAHKNIKRLRGERPADTTMGRSYPLFSFGMMDLSVSSVQHLNSISNTRISLGMGSIIAGGEANVILNYNSGQPFREREQYYLWRFANNNFRVVKQAMVGKINPFSTSSIDYPVVGIQLTNTPTTYRRSYGTYTLSEYTKPGWTVELYVNNTLVDYKQADASGFFTFQVPLVYGNTAVTLRFYGPWGQERSQEKNIEIPYSFVPKNKFEYRVSAAVVEDGYRSKYSRAELKYGLGHYMTVGGGVEYLSSVRSGSFMPFVNTTVSLGGKLLFSGSYTYGVQAKAWLNYRLSSGLQFDMEYTKYTKGQKAIRYNYLSVGKMTISMPVHTSLLALLTRLTVSRYVLPRTQYVNIEFLISGSIFGVGSNITTFANFSAIHTPYIYSTASLRFKVIKNLFVSPMIQYDYYNGQFIMAKCELEKRILKFGYLSAMYEENFRSHIRDVQVGLRIDFPSANTSAFARTGNRGTSFYESATSSMQFAKGGYVNVSNRSSVGRGGIIIIPFLDINNNGIHDKNEPKVYGLQVKVSSGLTKRNRRDTCIVVSELEPYSNCYIRLGLDNLDNIAWKIKHKIIKVAVNPNQLRVINVPVIVVGEVSGTVYRKSGEKMTGLGRILVNFYDKHGKFVAKTLTDVDGYFDYLGLSPGSYFVKIDPDQLNKLHMSASPDGIPITILPLEDGDIVDGLKFIITGNMMRPK